MFGGFVLDEGQLVEYCEWIVEQIKKAEAEKWDLEYTQKENDKKVQTVILIKNTLSRATCHINDGLNLMKTHQNIFKILRMH